jgi:hypothetical protein
VLKREFSHSTLEVQRDAPGQGTPPVKPGQNVKGQWRKPVSNVLARDMVYVDDQLSAATPCDSATMLRSVLGVA